MTVYNKSNVFDFFEVIGKDHFDYLYCRVFFNEGAFIRDSFEIVWQATKSEKEEYGWYAMKLNVRSCSDKLFKFCAKLLKKIDSEYDTSPLQVIAALNDLGYQWSTFSDTKGTPVSRHMIQYTRQDIGDDNMVNVYALKNEGQYLETHFAAKDERDARKIHAFLKRKKKDGYYIEFICKIPADKLLREQEAFIKLMKYGTE